MENELRIDECQGFVIILTYGKFVTKKISKK